MNKSAMTILKDKEIKWRGIKRKDLDTIFPLLNQLTEIDYASRDKNKCFDAFINNNSCNSLVGVYNNKVVAYGNIVLENKIRGELAGHIEDIVVDKNMRGHKIGENLIKELVSIGESKGCYRITLTCDESLISFYEKNGFKVNNIALKKFKL